MAPRFGPSFAFVASLLAPAIARADLPHRAGWPIETDVPRVDGYSHRAASRSRTSSAPAESCAVEELGFRVDCRYRRVRRPRRSAPARTEASRSGGDGASGSCRSRAVDRSPLRRLSMRGTRMVHRVRLSRRISNARDGAFDDRGSRRRRGFELLIGVSAWPPIGKFGVLSMEGTRVRAGRRLDSTHSGPLRSATSTATERSRSRICRKARSLCDRRTRPRRRAFRLRPIGDICSMEPSSSRISTEIDRASSSSSAIARSLRRRVVPSPCACGHSTRWGHRFPAIRSQ